MLIPPLFNSKIREHLELRSLTEQDVGENYVRWLNDEEIIKFTEIRHHNQDLISIKKFVTDKNQSLHEWLAGIFFDGKHIGNIKLGPINQYHKTADISFIIGERDYWQKGLASSSIKLMCEYGFHSLKLEKITAGCYETNMGSERALLNAGFIREATLEKAVIYCGRRINSHLFGLLKKNLA